MLDDAELLRRYAEEGSTDAFDQLARRHLDLVYSAALRQTGGQAHLAKDVTQMVLIDLARKARSLKGRTPIVGWLHTATRYAAATLMRTERNRTVRETAAAALNPPLVGDTADANWEAMRPVLDDALGELRETEREAVLLRYFKGHSYAAIGRELSLTETAARSRVDRALERLRLALTRRGIESTSTALAASIVRGATTTMPAEMAATLIGAAVAAGAGGAAAAAGTGIFAGLTSGKLGALFGDLLVMKLSTTALIASLAANAALGAVYFSRRTPDASYARFAGTSMAPITRDARANTGTTGPSGSTTTPKLDLTDQATLIRKMEQDGFDRDAIARGITGLHAHWSRPWMREDRDRLWARKRRWNLNPQGGEYWDDIRARVQQRDAQAAAAVVAAGFGPDPRKDLPYLSKEKAGAVQRIEADYAAVSGSKSSSTIQWAGSDPKTDGVIWREFEKDIRAALSPDEGARYLRANSPAAKQVQQVIRRDPDIDLNSEVYNRIVDQVIAGTSVPVAFRGQLGDEQFLSLFNLVDGRAANVDKALLGAGLSPQRRADLFIRVMATVAELKAAPPESRPALAQQAYESMVRSGALDGKALAAFNETELGRAFLETAAQARR